ncbi:hypothetical protein [Hyphomicrobium sp. CS1BSMeth3]|uniref:hypothetical protein n=1 Tax=Hyphomicrobium sp. CS1BSMeth3 TaxID=1892844 RepID=UPI0009314B6D|nr:hypothetical protein [Hyphomicrobium sp. CS1BSMeth3]
MADPGEDELAPRQSRNLLGALQEILADALIDARRLHSQRGETHLSIGDFGGLHTGAQFYTYAFLHLDLERNARWRWLQQSLRSSEQLGRRRMSFKSLNDKVRQRVLPQFLRAVDEIEGSLVVFAIAKNFGPLSAATAKSGSALSSWKLSVHEHLTRILYLAALCVRETSSHGQNVYWIVDQDEIASNERQLTELTKLFGNVYSNLAAHDLGHIRVGTTQSDDGTLFIEDSAAIADLAAGATCELITALTNVSSLPVRGIVNRLPRTITPKTQRLAFWLAAPSPSLRKIVIVLDDPKRSGGGRATQLNLMPIFDLIEQAGSYPKQR